MDQMKAMRKEVKKYIDVADEKFVKMVHVLAEFEEDKDWWDDLTDKEKKELNKAMEEAEKNSNHIPFETFQSSFQSWRKELLSSKGLSKK